MSATALTIAGSDSSGGAGIQQDLKTFAALGVWGLSAITGVTAQDPTQVHAIFPIHPDMVVRQVEVAAAASRIDAAKTGMLTDPAVVEVVAHALARLRIPNLVIDPVLASTGGQALLAEHGVERYRRLLFPIATLVTPNADEAAVFCGFPVKSADDQRRAAAAIRAMGPGAVLVKGGHVAGLEAVDVLDDGDDVVELRSVRLEGPSVHGTGCALSAAITAGLAQGMALRDAVARAKDLVHDAIGRAVTIGAGKRVLEIRP